MVQIEIIGNLGADIKRVNSNGNEFFSFNICDNRKVNGQEVSQWYGCTLNKASDNLIKYLVKGQCVFVRGIPRFRIFDSAVHHCKMVAIDVIINEVTLVGAKPDDNNNTGSDAGAQNEPQAATEGDEVMPF